MTVTQHLGGVHHVSAVTAHIGRTHDFYTQVLGMRPVIKTVNQDSPTMYHLFFGDGAGTPGSDMTMFDIPNAAPERRGNNSITLTAFRVSGEGTLEYWVKRLDSFGAFHGSVMVRDGRRVLDFEDFEGTQLSLIDDRGAGAAFPWEESPVPAQHQIRGLGYTTITVPQLEATHHFLAEALGLRHDRTYPAADAPPDLVHVYAIGGGGAHAEVHVVVRPGLPRSRHGAGGVHHVALRIPEGQGVADWASRLDHFGYGNSGVVDRYYFASVYVREPNGVLFELATDGPGFEVDGPLDGERLSLPPFLEPRRTEIEAQLRPLARTPLAHA
jgi:glyoxalase family protein